MARSTRQIEADAQLTRDAVKEAGAPLRVDQLAQYIRRHGRPQSEKQARMTVEHAERLGILERRGSRWGLSTTAAVHGAHASTLDEALRVVICARLLVDDRVSEHARCVLRDLLARAEDAVRCALTGVAVQHSPGPGNGVTKHDDPEIEVHVAPFS